MKKLLIILAVVCMSVFATTLARAEDPQPTMYTLNEIYYYLTEGVLPQEQRPGLEPTEGTPGEDVAGYTVSLQQILEDIKALHDQCDLKPEDITEDLTYDNLEGKTFFSTQSDTWGPYQIPTWITETFTASTTWTCSTGITFIQVEVWGGGGGGGGTNANGYAGGGGGGAYSKKCLSVIPGTSYSVTVGAGGVGGSNNNEGQDGGDSWFQDTSTVLAKGGSKGDMGKYNNYNSGGAGGSLIFGIGDVKYSGGNGGTGSNYYSYAGGGGGGAGTTENGGNASGKTGGVGGSLYGGNGGNGNEGSGSTPGNPRGGGGGGAKWNWSASPGARGEIVITYDLNQALK